MRAAEAAEAHFPAAAARVSRGVKTAHPPYAAAGELVWPWEPEPHGSGWVHLDTATYGCCAHYAENQVVNCGRAQKCPKPRPGRFARSMSRLDEGTSVDQVLVVPLENPTPSIGGF